MARDGYDPQAELIDVVPVEIGGPGAVEDLSPGESERRSLFGRRPSEDVREVPRWLASFGGALRHRWSQLGRPRRRLIVVGLIVALTTVLGSAIVVTRPGPGRSSAVDATRSGPDSGSGLGSAKLLPNGHLSFDDTEATSRYGPALTVPGGAVRDVAIADATLYILTASTLVVIDSYSRTVLRQTPVVSGADAQLVIDLGDLLVSVVDIGTLPSHVQTFDMATLKPDHNVVVEATIYDTTALNGWLYVATTGGVFGLKAGAAELSPVAATLPPAEALTPDPHHDAVLALSPGPNGRIVTIGGQGATIQAGPTLDVAYPTLARMNNTLWAGGIGSSGRAVRIDPVSLSPLTPADGAASVDVDLGTGLQLTAGVRDLWVYSRSTSRLYCVDDQTGQVLQYWDGISRAIATGGAGPYVVSSGTLVPLVLRGGCAG